MDSTLVAVVTASATFISALVAAIVAWNRAVSEDKAQFRADLFKLNESFKGEISTLRNRLVVLEEDVTEKSRVILALESRIERMKIVIQKHYSVDIDELMDKVERDDIHILAHGVNRKKDR